MLFGAECVEGGERHHQLDGEIGVAVHIVELDIARTANAGHPDAAVNFSCGGRQAAHRP